MDTYIVHIGISHDYLIYLNCVPVRVKLSSHLFIYGKSIQNFFFQLLKSIFVIYEYNKSTVQKNTQIFFSQVSTLFITLSLSPLPCPFLPYSLVNTILLSASMG